MNKEQILQKRIDDAIMLLREVIIPKSLNENLHPDSTIQRMLETCIAELEGYEPIRRRNDD